MLCAIAQMQEQQWAESLAHSTPGEAVQELFEGPIKTNLPRHAFGSTVHAKIHAGQPRWHQHYLEQQKA